MVMLWSILIAEESKGSVVLLVAITHKDLERESNTQLRLILLVRNTTIEKDHGKEIPMNLKDIIKKD